MSAAESGRSMAGSLAAHALYDHLERAGGSPDALRTVLWKIGGHPELISHARVLTNLNALLQTEVFADDAIYWAGGWRHEVPAWRDTLALIQTIAPTLESDPVLQPMFRQPRHQRDHPLLRHGVTRHPIPAALFNVHETRDSVGNDGVAAQRYDLVRAHVFAVYAEARARAARGFDAFMVYDQLKEFEPVPLGAGPVGLALREFSRAVYEPLLRQFPAHACTLDYAQALSVLQPDFSELPRASKELAARYYTDLQRYLSVLPALLGATELTPRTRKGTEAGPGEGGHELRPGWVGWSGTAIQRQFDLDWADDAPPITRLSMPSMDEDDAKDEEAEGDIPGSTRDEALEFFHPDGALQRMSQMRFRDQVLEGRDQEFPWSIDAATPADRARLMRIAATRIDTYLSGAARNQTVARQEAIGATLAKAAALFGWQPETVAAIAVRHVDRLDAQTIESLAYIGQSHITLLATQDEIEPSRWTFQAFLVPAVSPRYASQLAEDVAQVGRLRQTSFLLADAGGLGTDLLAIAHRSGRLSHDSPVSRRMLGVEGKSARAYAQDCIRAAVDPVCDDPRAALTLARLITSLRLAIAQASTDVVPAWLITADERRAGEARLFYTQVRASKLATWHQAALTLLQEPDEVGTMGAQALACLQAGWVGCRHVVDLEILRVKLGELQDELGRPLDLERRSEIRARHNAATLHAWLLNALPLGLRPVKGGVSLAHAIEQRRVGIPLGPGDATGVIDKHNGFQDKARLLPLTVDTTAAMTMHEQNNSAVVQRLDLLQEWRALDAVAQRLFVINDDESLAPITPVWIKRQLAVRGLPVPANFGRALLRTECLDLGCTGRQIDALLGHFGHRQNWFGKYSSHHPGTYLQTVSAQIGAYRAHIGLQAIPSQLVPAADRQGQHPEPWTLPPRGLKTPPPRLRLRPVWWAAEFAPPLPEACATIWKEVRRHAADSDRAVLNGLLWMLRNSASPHAQVLSGRALPNEMQLDEASAQQLVHEAALTMQRHQLPRTCLASWMRLLLAAQKRLQEAGVSLVTTPVLALTTEPTSPISALATLRLPDLAVWRAALHDWIRQRAKTPEEDPRYWAIAIAVSAVLHGMVLDLLLLSRILEHLALPGPRRLRLSGGGHGLAFLEFKLPSSVPGGQQTVRWFMDPLTELLVLQAPAFPTTPDLRNTARYLNPFLRHHGTPQHRCPGGWRTLIRTARAYWSTRVPQHIVQVAHRGISTTSLQGECWERLFGSRVLQSTQPGAVLEPVAGAGRTLSIEDMKSTGPSDEGKATQAQTDRAAAVAGAAIETGAGTDHLAKDLKCVHPWMHSAFDALASASSEALGRLETLHRLAPPQTFQQGALRWLHRTAAALQAEAGENGGNTFIGLRRVASTLLPRLSIEMGHRWFDSMNDDERARVPAALLHELESGTSRQDLRRGLALLFRFEPLARAKLDAADADAEQDDGDPALHDAEDSDYDNRVDARLMTIDEYERARVIIREGIVPPLTAEERTTLEDLLDLGTWSLARPREYLEARIGDFQMHGEDMRFVVREYAGHRLKTPQGVRVVPLSTIAPARVVERIRARIQRLLAEQPNPQSIAAQKALLFPSPSGNDTLTYHNRLLGLLRQILRQATCDPDFRVYSLRHSGANWVYMALESDGSDLWEQLWSSHPAMLQWLRAGPLLRERLLSTDDRTDRRALLAITKLQGHLASVTTFMHYLHLSGFLQLQAVLQLADETPAVIFAAAARINPASYSEQRASGWQTVRRNARKKAGWSESQQPEGDRAVHGQETEATWLSYEQFALLLNSHSEFRQSLPAIGQHFNMSAEQVEQIIREAAEICEVVDGQVRDAAVDQSIPSVVLPASRMNDVERLQQRHLLDNIAALWRMDYRLALQGVQLHLRRTTRRHRELALCEPDEVDLAARFFSGCNVAPTEVQIVLRRRGNEAQMPAWAQTAVGPYRTSPVKCSPPDTRSSEVALDRWMSLRLIDRKGQGIQNVVARVMFSAWLNLQVAGARPRPI